jgi:ferrochelatase
MIDGGTPDQEITTSGAAACRIGVLLINLGTPEGFGYWPMRRYLKEFLSDRRVIETNRVVWWFVLNAIILTRRPKKSGHAYKKIWNFDLDESPLKTITREQARALAGSFSAAGGVRVEWAMRYGKPPIAERLQALVEQGADHVLLAPLYPQYSAATTATALDKAFDALRGMRRQPAIRTLPPYYEDPIYIAALAESIRRHMAGLAWKPERIMASFHGLPEDYVEKGDPYPGHCMTTAQRLRKALGMKEEELVVAFQSRFGRAEWLKPYADRTAADLARQGCRKLLVVCPGFAADCVETLEEIGIGLKEIFARAGGKEFSVVPCLNASAASIAMLNVLVRQELAGWL